MFRATVKHVDDPETVITFWRNRCNMQEKKMKMKNNTCKYRSVNVKAFHITHSYREIRIRGKKYFG